jgi:hypothetical protein
MRLDVLILSVVAVCVAAVASAASLSVVEPNGAPAAKATAVCVAPASAEPLIVRDGRVELPGDCRRVRCDAPGFLPGEADVAPEAPRCALKPAVAITCELPASAAAGASLEARLLTPGTATSVAKNPVPKAASGRATTRAILPLVKPGRYTLQIARADGWSCRTDLGPLGAGPRRVAVLWREPLTLSARVKLADGKPAAGVAVRAWSGRPASRTAKEDAAALGGWICGMDTAARTTTDEAGLARLAIDLAGEALVVAGDSKDPHGLSFVTIDRAPAATIALTLAAPVTVRAKLEDEKHRPVACDAALDDLPPDILWLAKVLSGSPVKVPCDPQGVIAFGPLPSTAFTLSMVPRPGMPLRVTGEAPAPGTVADLGTLRVKDGESFRVVTQDELGHPVEGAKVTLRGASGVLLSVAGTTGDDGGVDLAGLPRNASVTFIVKAKGFLAARKDHVELDESPYVVKLSRGGAISGTVRDTDGQPIEGARVGISGNKDGAPDDVETDARGAFAFDGVDDGAWRLTAKAAGFGDSEPSPLTVQEHRPIEGVTITLTPAEGISGKVLDPSGSPVPGALVRLILSRQRDDFERAAPIAQAATGADGTFRIQAAAPPDGWIVATKAGLGPCALRSPDRAGRGELVLTLTDPASLVVHVAPGARTTRNVRVRDGAGLGRSSPAAGDSTFTDLAPGRGSAGLARGPEQGVTLLAGQTAEVTLEAEAVVEGRVTFEGAPSARTFVQAVEERDQGRLGDKGGAFTDERGRFRIDGLGGSTYRIVAVGEDGRAETAVALSDGETRTVDLALRAVKLVAFVTDGATGKPVSGAQLSAAPAGKSCTSIMGSTSWGEPGELGFDITVGAGGCTAVRADAAGIARLSVSAPGSYDIAAEDEAYERWSQPIALGEGTTTKKISLTRKPDKSGEKPKVIANLRTDPPGLPGTVECRWADNTNSSSPVSTRYECEMQPGPGEVAFHVEGYGRGRVAFEVPASGEIVVDVEVPRGGTLIVPVSRDSTAQPAIVDASGFAWSDGTGAARIPGSFEDLTSGGRGWVFRDMPPGTYTVTVEGKKRAPVPLASGSTAFAN